MNEDISCEQDKQIYNLCQTIRSFCFANAAREVVKTGGKSKEALDATKKTSLESEVGLLIVSKNWEKLFANEKWLVMLEEVALMNYLQKYEPARYALIILLELFPKETKGRINPLFLQKESENKMH